MSRVHQLRFRKLLSEIVKIKTLWLAILIVRDCKISDGLPLCTGCRGFAKLLALRLTLSFLSAFLLTRPLFLALRERCTRASCHRCFCSISYLDSIQIGEDSNIAAAGSVTGRFLARSTANRFKQDCKLATRRKPASELPSARQEFCSCANTSARNEAGVASSPMIIPTALRCVPPNSCDRRVLLGSISARSATFIYSQQGEVGVPTHPGCLVAGQEARHRRGRRRLCRRSGNGCA